eukprot:g24453.t1
MPRPPSFPSLWRSVQASLSSHDDADIQGYVDLLEQRSQEEVGELAADPAPQAFELCMPLTVSAEAAGRWTVFLAGLVCCQGLSGLWPRVTTIRLAASEPGVLFVPQGLFSSASNATTVHLTNVSLRATPSAATAMIRLVLAPGASVRLRSCDLGHLVVNVPSEGGAAASKGLHELLIGNCLNLRSVSTQVKGLGSHVSIVGCPALECLALPRATTTTVQLGSLLRELTINPEENQSVQSPPVTCTLGLPANWRCSLSMAGYWRLGFLLAAGVTAGKDNGQVMIEWRAEALPAWFRLQVVKPPALYVSYTPAVPHCGVFVRNEGEARTTWLDPTRPASTASERLDLAVAAAYFWLLPGALFSLGSPWRLAFLLGLSLDYGLVVSEPEFERCVQWLRARATDTAPSWRTLLQARSDHYVQYSLLHRSGPGGLRLLLLAGQHGDPNLLRLVQGGRPYPRGQTPAQVTEHVTTAVKGKILGRRDCHKLDVGSQKRYFFQVFGASQPRTSFNSCGIQEYWGLRFVMAAEKTSVRTNPFSQKKEEAATELAGRHALKNGIYMNGTFHAGGHIGELAELVYNHLLLVSAHRCLLYCWRDIKNGKDISPYILESSRIGKVPVGTYVGQPIVERIA